jgi:poly-gamma-glutamate synthesis protein (capsule biosynthesis protein)
MKKDGAILLLGAVFLFLLVSVLAGSAKHYPLHDSYFATPEISDNAFKQAKDSRSIEGIQGILVNHHLLAAKLIAQEFLQASGIDPEVVVVFSPNHFMRGDGRVIMSDADWNTPYGILKGAHTFIEKIADTHVASIDELPFDKEHGISGIVPFIKKVFPNAKVMPVIFKDSAKQDEVRIFVDELTETLPKKTLFVCSFDFSHDSIVSIADERDAVSKPILEGNQLEQMTNVAVDSKPGLYACMYAMSKLGAAFHLDENTNSSVLTGNPSQPDVTSYFVGYYK